MRVTFTMTKEVRTEVKPGTTPEDLAKQLENLARHIRGIERSGAHLDSIRVQIPVSETSTYGLVEITFDDDGALSETLYIDMYSSKERVKETESSTPEEGNQKEKVGKRKKN